MSLLLSQFAGLGLVDVTLKALLVIGLASLLAVGLRKVAASTRHAIWLAAIVLLITLPIAAVILPQLSLPLLPAESTDALSGSEWWSPLVTELAPSPTVIPPVTAGSPAVWSWSTWALLVWGVGASLVIIRAAVGFIRLDRLRRRAEGVDDPAWRAAVERARGQTEVQREVRLLQSPRVVVPMTWGLKQIAICLPMHASEWSVTNRRMVLAHELTHIQRGDWLWQVLALAMTTVHWFNPLAWWAAHRMRIEAEIACDDAVIASGCRASDYADCLYQMVRAGKAARFQLISAIPMARPSELPRRLTMILSGKTKRHQTGFRTLMLALLVSMVLGSLFAAAQIDRAQPETTETQTHVGIVNEIDAFRNLTLLGDGEEAWVLTLTEFTQTTDVEDTLARPDDFVGREVRVTSENGRIISIQGIEAFGSSPNLRGIPADASLIKYAVASGVMSAEEGDLALGFTELYQAVKVGDENFDRDEIADWLEKLDITWEEGQILLRRAIGASPLNGRWIDERGGMEFVGNRVSLWKHDANERRRATVTIMDNQLLLDYGRERVSGRFRLWDDSLSIGWEDGSIYRLQRDPAETRLAEYRAVEAEISAAVEVGEITREEAGERLAATRQEMFGDMRSGSTSRNERPQ